MIETPKDWESHIAVSGFYFLPSASVYTPPPGLQSFLSDGPPPVYVGFGSIVVDDPQALTLLIVKAVSQAGVRAIISHGWSDIGAIDAGLPSTIYTIGNCPHDWIFRRVSCVVHHGGAGTTAAAMVSGKCSVVVPFFGDQPFWGKVVSGAGVGPEPIPYKRLTAERLAYAIQIALEPDFVHRAQVMGERMAREEGVDAGVRSFHKQLLKSKLSCSISPTRPATWRIRKTQIRLSSCAAAMLMNENLLDLEKVELQVTFNSSSLEFIY